MKHLSVIKTHYSICDSNFFDLFSMCEALIIFLSEFSVFSKNQASVDSGELDDVSGTLISPASRMTVGGGR